MLAKSIAKFDILPSAIFNHICEIMFISFIV